MKAGASCLLGPSGPWNSGPSATLALGNRLAHLTSGPEKLGPGRDWRAWLVVGSACPCLRARSASCSPCQQPGTTSVQSGPRPEWTGSHLLSAPAGPPLGPQRHVAPSEAGPMVSGPPCQGWDSSPPDPWALWPPTQRGHVCSARRPRSQGCPVVTSSSPTVNPLPTRHGP